jgi:CheY-like chemotaxis protein
MKKKFQIVVADDDLDDQDMIKLAFKNTNSTFEVIPVYNGLQLMDYLLKRESYKHITDQPDLIILDLNMPVMDGFEVLQEVHMRKELKDLPIYILSTSWQDRDKQKAINLGARGFYTKPVSIRELNRIFEEVCSLAFPGSYFSGKPNGYTETEGNAVPKK